MPFLEAISLPSFFIFLALLLLLAITSTSRIINMDVDPASSNSRVGKLLDEVTRLLAARRLRK